jgi:hypothetical protein
MKSIKPLLTAVLLIMVTAALNATLHPVNLLCENLKNPMVVDILQPRLSWINSCPENVNGQVQTAYEIELPAAGRSCFRAMPHFGTAEK